ncbi:MAG: ABC transporter ATP-binding protein [Candidatus Magasanikbacteria bacterium]|nr:ABC transporter ATP-binding protein [Candidatus Magasanikbacteria bacterium]
MPIIEVKNVSKKYQIGERQPYLALRDTLSAIVKAPVRWLRSRHSPTKVSDSEFWALKDINFSVEPGEVLGIIGRNGAGKSTLLKLLSQITPPTTGEIKLNGRVGSLLEIGTGFHPELTGRENVYLNGAILGMRKREIEKKFDEIVDFAGIEKFLDTPVKRYSSGMYVRLAFAVAAHLEPEILVIDEVLAVGDAEFQKKCLGKMDEVTKKEGRTILFVSHNMGAIRSLCRRVITLEKGRLVGDDSASVSIEKYINNLSTNVFEKEWDNINIAPSNSDAAIRSVRITDENEKIVESLSIDDPFNIEIEYDIKVEGAYFGMTAILYDINGNCILSSINNKEQSWYGKPMPLGRYKSICKIPGCFLNNGWLNLNINIFGRNFLDIKTIPDVLHFELQDGQKVRGDYFGGYGSILRPSFDWDTYQI